jgi:hypothetical protein
MIAECWFEVSKALTGLRYGSIEIMVHDGKVTQIEAKKKDPPETDSNAF